MGLMDWLRKLVGGEASSPHHWIYVRCLHCGEDIKTRLDLAHDLSVRYDEGGEVAGYFTRKTLIGGGPCFNQIQVEIEFNRQRQATEHRVHGGELLPEEQYEQEREGAKGRSDT